LAERVVSKAHRRSVAHLQRGAAVQSSW
jgi:hypothetical protein